MKKHLQVVGAMLVNEEGRILSTLRPLGKKLGNYWEFPGGKVEKRLFVKSWRNWIVI